MGKMKIHLILTTVVLLLCACSSDNEDNPLVPVESERSVLIYMAGENNLSGFADLNLDDIKLSSKSLKDNQNLIVFVDRYGIKPYMARVKGGVLVDSVAIVPQIPIGIMPFRSTSGTILFSGLSTAGSWILRW